MKKIKLALFSLLAFGVALPAHAQLGNLGNLIEDIGDIVDSLVPILVGIAVVVFFWGLVKFIFNAGDEDKRKDGRQIMVWGIIAIFVIAALWGLVEFLAGALDVDTGGTIDFPTV